MSAETVGTIALYEFLYAMMGMFVGIACIGAGVALLIHGIAGSTSWTTNVLGLKNEVHDAAPGVVFAILGSVIVWITRFRMKARQKDGA